MFKMRAYRQILFPKIIFQTPLTIVLRFFFFTSKHIWRANRLHPFGLLLMRRVMPFSCILLNYSITFVRIAHVWILCGWLNDSAWKCVEKRNVIMVIERRWGWTIRIALIIYWARFIIYNNMLNLYEKYYNRIYRERAPFTFLNPCKELLRRTDYTE